MWPLVELSVSWKKGSYSVRDSRMAVSVEEVMKIEGVEDSMKRQLGDSSTRLE